ncbi:unnamed protein product [Staurois parvus]|uniref:Uncharacterized protein n=1 Tax=Staurois parvus TaxID=386267 RepID=A0ABN9FJH7_9NEOB|nr:unnamed protein product [Staurois parvus]
MGPPAIGDHGAPVSLPKKKAYEKGTRGISWGPLLTPGPRAVPEFPNGQSAPGHNCFQHKLNLVNSEFSKGSFYFK